MDKKLKMLIEEYYRLLWGKNENMIKYSINNVSNAVLLSNGLIYIFEKNKLKTDFCFGYDNDSESQDIAHNLAYAVKNDYGKYFIESNIKSYITLNEILNEKNNKFLVYNYYSNDNVKICKSIYKKSDVEYNSWLLPRNVKTYELSKEDIKKIIEINNFEIEKMTKRCVTYIKKYGTDKLKTWTYWRD